MGYDSWEQLEREFLNHFYSTCQVVNMIKLTNARQWKKKPISITFIDGETIALIVGINSLKLSC
jgi:hypothetical protein